MRLLSWSKRPEAMTDDSHRSAVSSWRSPLKLLMRSRVAAAASPKHQQQPKHEQQQQQQQQQKQQQQQQQLEQFETDYDGTDSGMDLFQTLMSNSGAPPAQGDARSAIVSGNNRRSLHYWHTNDPDFLPSAYPLTRTDPRSHPEARWGSLDLAASAALLEGPLKRFDSVRDKHPRFRLGPRLRSASDAEDDRRSDNSGVSSRSRSVVDASTPKYAFISQDGKLVEREVYHWPTQKQPDLTMRYKLSEPYASNYGKMAIHRSAAAGQKYTLPRTRWIYERPIYLLPRSIINENKRRLMMRHTMKDRCEPTASHRLPCSVSLEESEQCKRYLEHQAVKNVKDTECLIAHTEKMKLKNRSNTSLPLQGDFQESEV